MEYLYSEQINSNHYVLFDDDVRNYIENDLFSINWLGKNLIFKINYADFSGVGRIIYEANLISDNFRSDYSTKGDFIFTQHLGEMNGVIRLENVYYSIVPSRQKQKGKTIHIVSEYPIKPIGVPTKPLRPIIPPINPVPCALDCGPAQIDVLLLFDNSAVVELLNDFPESIDVWETAKTIASQFEAELNGAFSASKIKQKSARLKVDFIPNLPLLYNYPESVANQLSQNPVANAKRDEYGADIVFLVTGSSGPNSLGFNGVVAGINGGSDLGYGILDGTYINGLLSAFTFSHECGHIFGGRHEHDGNECDRGYVFPAFTAKPDVGQYSTIMAIGSDFTSNTTRYLLFSNPELSLGFFPGGELWAGIWGENEVAHIIDQSACGVSEFRKTADDDFDITIHHNLDPCTSTGEVEFCAIIDNETDANEPFTFLWEIQVGLSLPLPNPGIFSTTNTPGEQQCYEFNIGDFIATTDATSFTIQVTVISNQGIVKAKAVSFNCQNFAPDDKGDLFINSSIDGVIISPNPISYGNISIDFEKQPNRFSVIDVNGRIIIEGFLGDSKKLKIDADKLEKGIFFLKLENIEENYLSIHKFIKQ